MGKLSELGLWSGGRVRDVGEHLLRLTASDTPYLSMCPKGRKIFNSTPEWPFQTRPTPSKTPVADGTDVVAGDMADYESLHGMLKGRATQYRKPFGVGKRAQLLTRQYGGIKDKFKQYGLLAMEQLGLSIEMGLKGPQDNWTETVSGQPRDQTRGFWRWIQDNTYLPLDPDTLIPAACRAPAANGVTTRATVAAYVEDDIRGVMQSIATTTKRKKANWVMLLSPAMKAQFSNFSYTQVVGNTGANHNVPLRHFNQEASSKKILLDVTAYEGDFGVVKLMVDFDLNNGSADYTDTKTATADNGLGRTAAAQDMDAGLDAALRIDWLLINLDFTEINMVQAPQMTTLPDGGGGPSAYVDAIFVHSVLNPQAHGYGSFITD